MSTTILDHAGTLARRHRLYGYIQSGNIGPLVLAELLPEGQPHQYEKQLWDYKLEIPTRAVAVRLGAQEERLFEVRMAELIKDVVAFFNTCGGYVVVGVNNTPRQIVGFNRDFDCDDLIKRVRGATTHEIDCHYALLDYKIGKMNKRIGLLHIPKRPDGQEPAQFLRDAPEDSHGTRAFSRYSIYLRAGSESRPATSSADFNFLCSPGRRTITCSEYATPTPVLDNNLGPRDPGFIRFVGRENYLQGLWRWSRRA